MRLRIRLQTLVFILVLPLVSLAPTARAQGAVPPIDYRIAMSNPASHLFEVTITVPLEGTEKTVDFQMPAWSPGRYVIYDFARNVGEVAVTDGTGRSLLVRKTDKQTWRVEPNGARSIAFRYQVFADNLSGTFSQLDPRHGNFNGASVFMYVVDSKPHPVRLTVVPPEGWRVYNALTREPDQTVFELPNYDRLIDTPTEIAPDFEVVSFRVDGTEYRVLVHQLGRRHPIDRYVADVERIVRAQAAIIPLPEDLDRYTFLVHFAPGTDSGDGMEHLTSTQIVMTNALGDEDRYQALLSVTSHEHFHLWNVKRLRPAELGPWDYTRENYTRSLWIAEGLTSYYDDLILARTGLITHEAYYDNLAQEIGELENRPGHLVMSAEQASFDTWLYLAVTGRQRSNVPAVSISYYNKGELIGLLLDLEIRHRTKGARSLEDVFRLLYDRFYAGEPAETYYLAGRGYRPEDFLAAVDEVAGSDFGPFFARYVSGTAPLDYETALGYVGLSLTRERRVTKAEVDAEVKELDGQIRIVEMEGDGLAARSGLREGDAIVRVEGQPPVFEQVRELFEEGRVEPTRLTVERGRRRLELELIGIPSTMIFDVVEDPQATEAQRAMRATWLSVKGQSARQGAR